jgi:hypothetical protein
MAAMKCYLDGPSEPLIALAQLTTSVVAAA